MDFKAIQTNYIEEKHTKLLVKINPDYGVEKLVEQIVTGKWTLYDVTLDKILVGVFVCRTDKKITGENELVILHTVSVLKEKVPFFAILEPLIDEVAENSNCKSIRLHTTSDAVARLVKKHTDNYLLTETIFTKVL